MKKLSEKIDKVKQNIASACDKAGRDVQDVKIIVVTKSAQLEEIKEVIKLGFTDLGESQLQHLEPVAEEIKKYLENKPDDSDLPEKVNWHMIGHLQRNKVGKVLKIASTVHSVDTLRLTEDIDRTAAKLGLCPEVMLQINCSQEPQKYGMPVGAALPLAEQICTMDNLKLVGLMTMAPLTLNKDLVRACFVRARDVFEDIKASRSVKKDFMHLSMGMSQDYEIAVEEGATILRIGSAIFKDSSDL